MMKEAQSVHDLFNNEKAGGIVLIACTAASLLLANSGFGGAYADLFKTRFIGMSIEHWINDVLMAVFFFDIGLELKREVLAGELSSLKKSSLPLMAALGGMIVPAGTYLLFNYGTPSQSGAGIPMATDIVFAIGILSLVGKRVPDSLTVLLTALAVIDDLGAILVIAVFYTARISWLCLLFATGVLVVLAVFRYFNVRSFIPYMIGGILLWIGIFHSGVHATIAGVLLALVIPFDRDPKRSLSHRLEHVLEKPVTFGVLPVFAIANTAIVIGPDWIADIARMYSLGIIAGLSAGKPIGIFLFGWMAIRMKMSVLPQSLNLRHLLGMGFLGGIGFTMSIFITLLAFADPGMIDQAKIAILLASLVSGIMGYFWLRMVPPEQ